MIGGFEKTLQIFKACYFKNKRKRLVSYFVTIT